MSTPTADAEIEAVLAMGFPSTRFQGFWVAVGPAGPVVIESFPAASTTPAMRLREALQAHIRVLSAPVDAASVSNVLLVPGPLVPDTATSLLDRCVEVLSAPEPAPAPPANMFSAPAPVPAPSAVPAPAPVPVFEEAEVAPPGPFASSGKPKTPLWLWAVRILVVVLLAAVVAPLVLA